MAIAALPRRRAPVLRAITRVRRYPLLPISVLMIVLVIPGIFANIIAKHDPVDAEVTKRLIPPFWEDGLTETRTLVNTLAPFGAPLRDTQMRIKTAARNVLEPGDVRRKDGVFPTEAQKPLFAQYLISKDPAVLEGQQVLAVIEPWGNDTFPLGTDKVGRDQLSRIIFGARISLSIAAISIVLGLIVGVSLGLVAGYFGGNIDHVIMRIVDIKLALPSILLALVIASIMRPSFWTVVFVIALVLWSRFARMVRGETLKVKELDYISRAKVAGASNARIMFRHIFPNVVNSMIVLSTLEVGHVILFEASLSFLGVGIPRPDPAWGLMVADGRELVVTAWWVAFFPGLAIMFTVLSMNLFGDWLRDQLDPKLRNLR